MRDKFLVEIFEDYKLLTTDEKRIAYEDELIDLIWEQGIPYRIVTRSLDFKINSDLVGNEFASVFRLNKNIEYKDFEIINTYDKEECIAAQWLNLFRFQIGFIYATRYLSGYCYNKEYEMNLRKVKDYYFKVIEKKETSPRIVSRKIHQALDKAEAIKKKTLASKPSMSWEEYIDVVNDTIRKCLKSYTPLESYISCNEGYFERYQGTVECGVDSFPCAYLRKALRVNAFKYIQNRDKLPHTLRKKKSEKYGINERYGTCQRCGKTMVVKSNAKKYCDACNHKRKLERDRQYKAKKKANALSIKDSG